MNNNLQNTTPHLGYFLSYSFWSNALKLIEYQLSLKPKNKHFNTLSMFYYERLDSIKKGQLNKEEYFNERIANNLFYGLEKEFAIHTYPIPKSNLGLRRYCFFTYPMRAAYYAVGLYLLGVSQEFIMQYYNLHKHILSDYGGDLTLDENRNLKLSYDAVWYKPHYKEFRNRIRKEVDGDIKDKIVIHIDIQNYFEEISVQTLLDFITKYVKPSVQREMRFDPITKGQIVSFFDFIGNGRSGIPQNDNDVISSFIGHLYLVFGDLLIDEEISRAKAPLKGYAIFRYMDDMYIALEFDENIPIREREIAISLLAARIADCLYQKLGLRLNTKTRLFWLNNEDDKLDLLKNLKRVSANHEIPTDDTQMDVNQRLELIFKQLEKLKKASLDPTFDTRGELDDEIFKEVYNEKVDDLLHKQENKRRIHEIFTNFNFDLVIAQPREILILMLIDQAASKRFEKFLLKKESLTSRDVYLILSYLCQIDFKSKKLVKLLQENRIMKRIMRIYQSANIPTKRPGYFGLKNAQVVKIAQCANVIDQIRLRVQCERRHEYSVGLNHLLNEIHAICARIDPEASTNKKYEAPQVIAFLIRKKIPHETCIKIRNLFDRRNKNPVSHPDPIAWPVSKNEYFDYYKHVGVCLSCIL